MTPHCVEDEWAKALDARSLAMCWQLKDQPALASWLGALDSLAAKMQQPGRVSRMLGAADALHCASCTRGSPADQAEVERRVGAVRAPARQVAIKATSSRGPAQSMEPGVETTLESEVLSAAVRCGLPE